MGPLIEQLGARPYLDANVVVYMVENYDAYVGFSAALTAALDQGNLVAVTSELTLAEVLVKPYQLDRAELIQAYETFLEPDGALQVEPVTGPVLREAARLRARSRLRLPDAIHAATAVAAGCSVLLTNDHGLRQFQDLPVKLVADLLTGH
jgi:predicted nucleic acid-binding protein